MMNNKTAVWVKVGIMISDEIKNSELSQDFFDVTFGSSYKIQVANTDGEFSVYNAVNGYGNNCYDEFKGDKVEILSIYNPSPSPTEPRTAEEILNGLFGMQIDIEGNIGQVGWMPDKESFKFIGEDFYNKAVAEFTKANEKVCFKNTHLDWDSCDCGDGYGCSHGSWVYQIHVIDENGRHEIEIEDDSLYFQNKITNLSAVIPLTASVGDFYRACKMCGINLELSDYALSLSESMGEQIDGEGIVKIKTKKDLPKERMNCWFHDKEKGWVAGEFLNNGKDEIDFILVNATHYKPILKPLPPKSI